MESKSYSPGRVTKVLIFLLTTLGTTALTLHFFSYVEVSGISMEPTLQNGDRLLILKSDEVERGSYLLFPMPDPWLVYDSTKRGHTLIKRVIAVPGDELSWNGRNIFVNGSARLDLRGQSCYAPNFTITIRENQAFVVGDNGPVSIDSRRVMCDGGTGYLVSLKGTKSGEVLAQF